MKSLNSHTALVLSLFVCALVASAIETHYEDGTPIHVLANKIGPYNNPTESYEFYDALKWCQPSELKYLTMNIGEVLQGDRLVKTNIELPFKEERTSVPLCTLSLSYVEAKKFEYAIKQRYIYDFHIDGLPIKLFVGETSKMSAIGVDTGDVGIYTYLYTHIDFLISYNKDQVIEASASPGFPVELAPVEGQTFSTDMTYSVKWVPTDLAYSRRHDKYKDPYHVKDLEIQRFAIANASISILVLVFLFMTIVVRLIRKDFRDYRRADVEKLDIEEQGWKLVSGEVFKAPDHLTFFSAFIGTGMQLLVLCSLLLLLGVLEIFHPLSRGSLLTSALVIYALTSFIAGGTSGYIYKHMGGEKWIGNTLLVSFLFGGPLFVVWALLNTMAFAYHSTRVIPIWTFTTIFLLWCLVTLPLFVLGSLLGKKFATPFQPPARLSKIPRHIPESPWYRSFPFLTIISGGMPYSCIFLEIYYIFNSIWGHKIFTIYEMLAITFVLLLISVSLTSVSMVYFKLAVEDYRWWWGSIAFGGSVGLYLYAHSIIYYFFSSPLEGLLQTSFFFGYMLVASYALLLMCGTIGYLSSRKFVLYIFSTMKNE